MRKAGRPHGRPAFLYVLVCLIFGRPCGWPKYFYNRSRLAQTITAPTEGRG